MLHPSVVARIGGGSDETAIAIVGRFRPQAPTESLFRDCATPSLILSELAINFTISVTRRFCYALRLKG